MALDRIPGSSELYIGGLFSLRRYQALKNASITHVVSALRLPLDEDLFTSYKHLVVELDDVEDEDILQHFATSNAFIRDGLAGGGGVLVHWCVPFRHPHTVPPTTTESEDIPYSIPLSGLRYVLSR
ncbi:tyrosine protein phosphatase yvh1 [Lambiella insularis]|nr:tyrosine protein phosphatase yvh1 [Lambiella insularis]